ncbi:hypothetical protein EST38_g2879 [Candolleomyces aberdarensis]|uniref:Matrin-type domain-containing protein n=1 Tax=Candolleomyces aberdarensis TaxID=2316362 RepID=A0A4Q2DTK9_9AGAR|nr:hypothetical protein EST38_g2879 [Candolleomyces aberdarensis]
MSEYWVSKKKYFCKYCEIYIADDAPSRNHHESGMRHKGNLERYIRGIYKQGVQRKKDQEEEKREMERVEKLANAAFAEDVGAGRASAAAGPSKPTAARRPADSKPSSSGPWANYSTAESLGYTDPDAERLAAEQELRRSQGVAGEWEVLSTVNPTPPPPQAEAPLGEEEDVKPDVSIGEKRPAETIVADEEDTRSFKIRKRTLGTGLGEIYDPGLIPIKVKKKEEPVKEEETKPEELEPAAPLKWTPLQLKSSSAPNDSTSNAEGSSESSAPSTSGSKWAKVSWGPAVDPELAAPFAQPEPPVKTEEATEAPTVEQEESKPNTNIAPTPSEAPAPVFKKRKAPASSARGRRQM